jgi:3-phosphoshikimate 1-carboxyvinyltransferase
MFYKPWSLPRIGCEHRKNSIGRGQLAESVLHMKATDSVVVAPAKSVSGSLRMAGDKSISHRYAMLAALAEGETRLTNFSTGADCASTLGCLQQLGCSVQRDAKGELRITGSGGGLQTPTSALDCGNSGSTMRMLAGILAGQDFQCRLTGDASLSRRPMGRVITPLTQMGARIEATNDGCPPLVLHGAGGKLRAIDYAMPVASAQVKSAVLFAGLFAKGKTAVEEPVRTRDHGELALRAFGAEVTRSRNRISIAGGQKLRGITAVVPGDISSAAFFLCAAALFPGSKLVFDNLLLNPTRAALLDVLVGMGTRISVVDLNDQHGELLGTVQVTGGELRGAMISGAQSAALIDELPVLAAIAPYTRDGIEIRGARELRVKESDRIRAVAENLRAMGAEVEELEDGLRVPGGQRLHGATVDSAGDHRIAMAFAIAALKADGESEIRGADCVNISFPEFFGMLDAVSER